MSASVRMRKRLVVRDLVLYWEGFFADLGEGYGKKNGGGGDM